jgi:hypothetical protein
MTERPAVPDGDHVAIRRRRGFLVSTLGRGVTPEEAAAFAEARKAAREAARPAPRVKAAGRSDAARRGRQPDSDGPLPAN